MKPIYSHLYLCFIACVVGYLIFQFMEINDLATDVQEGQYNTQHYQRDSLNIDSAIVIAMPIKQADESN